MSKVPTNTYGFFLVWNPEARAPSQRHATFQSALGEAQRLAEKEPNRSFYVMQAVNVSRGVPQPRVVTQDVHYPINSFEGQAL